MAWRVRPKPCRFVTTSPIDAEGFDGFIDVEFALSKFGMASNPHIISNSAANRQIERELLLEIRSCKFRPKFVADAPTSEKMQLRSAPRRARFRTHG